MWTVKPAPIPVQFLRRRPEIISVGYSQPPPRNYDGIHRKVSTKSQTSKSETIGELGQQIILRTAESNPNKPIAKEKEISGSDVLWAIQRATAQRKRLNADKKKTKKMMTRVEMLSSVDESTGYNGVDYNNVRPLSIKCDWKHRLDEFEKLLKEFEETEL